MPLVTLDKLVPGEAGRIRRVGGRGALRHRLLDMGFTRGGEIRVLRVSPLGDPVEYQVRGCNLSLRASEARMIEVDLLRPLAPGRSRGPSIGSTFPLAVCSSGQKVVITGTRGGRQLAERFMNLGLLPGTEIGVVSNQLPGPLIISLPASDRLSLGRGMALHIQVKPA